MPKSEHVVQYVMPFAMLTIGSDASNKMGLTFVTEEVDKKKIIVPAVEYDIRLPELCIPGKGKLRNFSINLGPMPEVDDNQERLLFTGTLKKMARRASNRGIIITDIGMEQAKKGKKAESKKTRVAARSTMSASLSSMFEETM